MRNTLALAVFLYGGLAAAGEVSFSAKPAAAKDGEKAKITFAVTAPTDVEVAVMDAAGKVVSHLAAGMLGAKNPPPAPLKAGLAQSLVWDGKDDTGKPAAGGPFKVRVKLGMTPTFDSFMLYEPGAFPEAKSLAVGPKGEVYVFYEDPTANNNQGGHKVRIVTREGKFVRQILPFPADLPYAKVKATGAFQDADGSLVPYCHNWHALTFYPDTKLARAGAGGTSYFSQPAVDANGRLYWIAGSRRLCAIEADGSIPYDTFLSEPLFPELKGEAGRPALAISTDGKHLYAAGIADGMKWDAKAVPCVWRIDIATRKAEVFLGNPTAPGKEKDRFTSPRGVAAAGGLLYIADPDAGRVAVFKEADKSFVGEIKCTLPHIVQVHPKTGAVYVCSYVPEDKPAKDGKSGIKDANLLKFASYKDAKPAYQMALPRTGVSPNGGLHRIALDPSAEPPLIWAPGLPYAKGAGRIACYRDTGAAFEPVDVAEPKGPWGSGVRDLLVDRARGDVYVKAQGEQWYQFEEKTGKLVRKVSFAGGPVDSCSGAQLGVDSAGNYITHSWGNAKGGLMRWSRDLKPLKWDGKDTNGTDWGGMMCFQLRYMALFNDLIYFIKPCAEKGGAFNLDAWDMGLKQQRRAVWNVRRGSCPRLDAKGNIYITAPLRPEGRDFEEFFDNKLAKIPDRYNGVGNGPQYWYTYMAGAIVKFPPEGGAFHWPGDGRAGTDLAGLPEKIAAKPKVKHQYFKDGLFPRALCEVQGADWVRYSFAPYSETYGAGTPTCMCEGNGFDVDGFGRVWHTNLFRFRVEVADNNNNTVTTFGKYGNQDSGPEGRVKTPSIPLAWPTYVAVSDDYAYVNDTIGMRVVRVRLGAAAEETCEVR